MTLPPPSPGLQVTLRGQLLQPAALRFGMDGSIAVQLVLSQPAGMPPAAAIFKPRGSGAAARIAWRQQLRTFGQGVEVQVAGRGLRLTTMAGRRVLMLDADELRLLRQPFDGRAAAAGMDS